MRLISNLLDLEVASKILLGAQYRSAGKHSSRQSVLWRSGLGLLMGKFRQIFTELICLRNAHIFISGQ